MNLSYVAEQHICDLKFAGVAVGSLNLVHDIISLLFLAMKYV